MLLPSQPPLSTTPLCKSFSMLRGRMQIKWRHAWIFIALSLTCRLCLVLSPSFLSSQSFRSLSLDAMAFFKGMGKLDSDVFPQVCACQRRGEISLPSVGAHWGAKAQVHVSVGEPLWHSVWRDG